MRRGKAAFESAAALPSLIWRRFEPEGAELYRQFGEATFGSSRSTTPKTQAAASRWIAGALNAPGKERKGRSRRFAI